MHHTQACQASRRRIVLGGLGALCLQPALASAARPERQALFGTLVELHVPSATPARRLTPVWQGLQRMNAAWNAWKPGALTGLNEALRSGRWARPAPALRVLIQGAALLERRSGGLFNPAIGHVVSRWGFHADHLADGPPPALADRWARQPPTLASLQWDGPALRCPDPRVQLDFGAYAKGFALDWALDRLDAERVHDALLNLGGNLAATGAHDGRAWTVGIRRPSGGLLTYLQVRGREAVVTSGRYERYRVHGGQTFAHVIDPRRAAPADGLDSVTVVHPDAALADAAATALLVAGAKEWPAVAARMGVQQVLVVDTQGRSLATPALRPRLQGLHGAG